MVPLPAVFVVRILKVKLVVPEKFRLKVVPAADSVVVDVFIWIAASGAIVADKVVLPVEANCAWAELANTSSKQPGSRQELRRRGRCRSLLIFFLNDADPEDHRCRI
jgi:hypothetical protein